MNKQGLEVKVSLDHPLVAYIQNLTLHAPPAMVATSGCFGMEGGLMLEMMSKQHVMMVSSRIYVDIPWLGSGTNYK